MNKVILAILASLLTYIAESVLGVDVSNLYSEATYQCMKKKQLPVRHY